MQTTHCLVNSAVFKYAWCGFSIFDLKLSNVLLAQYNHMTAVEHIVMSRVHRIHLLRRVFNTTAVKAYGLTLLFLGLLSTVSVSSIYANMVGLGAPSQMGQYLLGALLNTDLVVKLLVLGMLASAVMFLRDVLRSVSDRVAVPFVRV